MRKRLRRAIALIAVLLVSYAVKLAGDSGADMLTDIGSGYECKGHTFYNGSECVKAVRMAPAPPCYLGWEERDKSCYWKGE